MVMIYATLHKNLVTVSPSPQILDEESELEEDYGDPVQQVHTVNTTSTYPM